MVTPVPIPNTEVKHFRGENSYACHSEGSSLPGSLVPFNGNLFLILSYEQARDKGSFKNSVGERKTETRKTQMSSRKGTHFKLRKRQGTKVLEISKMRVLN